MRYRPTTAQLELVRRLWRAAELETRTLSLMHRAPLQAAGLWCSADNGRSVDEFLGQLTQGDARKLIDALKALQGDAQ